MDPLNAEQGSCVDEEGSLLGGETLGQEALEERGGSRTAATRLRSYGRPPPKSSGAGQNGLTITKDTIATVASAGTSLTMRSVRSGRSRRPVPSRRA